MRPLATMHHPLQAFREAYAAHRKEEGRAYAPHELVALPYLRSGPLAGQWSIRARTFSLFERRLLRPRNGAVSAASALDILDLGAGNGWLSYRAHQLGHRAVAVDVRTDHVDGLGAASRYFEYLDSPFERVCASFEALPFPGASFDVVVFNASLHYALDLVRTIREARRVVRPGGRLVILDSPFYATEEQGAEMVAQKRMGAWEVFGDRADELLSLPFIEFLTAQRLATASSGLGLEWRRHRVGYPIRYELRPLLARLKRRRAPSRFDLWEAIVR